MRSALTADLIVAHDHQGGLDRRITENLSNIPGALDQQVSYTPGAALLLLDNGLTRAFSNQAASVDDGGRREKTLFSNDAWFLEQTIFRK